MNSLRRNLSSPIVHVVWLALAAGPLLPACGDSSSGGGPSAGGGEGGADGSEGGKAGHGAVPGSAGAQVSAGTAGSSTAGTGGTAPSTGGGAGSAVQGGQANGGDPSGGEVNGGDANAGEANGGVSTALGGAGGAGGEASTSCEGSLVVIAQAPKAWSLAVDDGYVYFTSNAEDGKVLRVPVGGGSAETIATGELYPHSLAVASGHVFWANLGSLPGYVLQADVTGQDRKQLATGLSSGVFSLSADASNLYYVTDYNVVLKVPVGGGTAGQLSGGPYNSMIVDMALQGPTLFWTNTGLNTFVPTKAETAGTFSVETSGTSAASPVVNRLDYPQFQIAVNEEYVFWNDEAAIYRTGLLGGVPTQVTPLEVPFALGQAPIVDLAANATHVYFSDGTSIFRAPALGGAAEVVTSGWKRINSLSLDASNVYFTDSLAGSVVKVPQCATGLARPQTETESAPVVPLDAPVSLDAACDPLTSAHGCPEATVVASVTSPFGLAADEDYVYFSTLAAAGSIMRLPRAGGSPEPVAQNEPWPHDIAIDDTNVYWCLNDAPSGHLARATKAGGERKTLVNGIGNGVGRVTSDGTFAYFTTGFNSVFRVHVDGGSLSMIAGGRYNSGTEDVAAFDGEVFWLNAMWNANYTAKLPDTGYLGRAPVSGSSHVGHFELSSYLSGLARVAVDQTYVYYVDDVAVYRAPRSGGEPLELAPLADGTVQVVDLHTDGQTLYFADLHAVYRLPVAGGAVETLSHGWNSLRALAVTDTDVYFTDYGGGAVVKVPK